MQSLPLPLPESCGSCSLCCKILEIHAEPEIDFTYKAWNTWCVSCKPGALPGGCQRYDNQPKACSIFQCVWLQSQERTDVPTLPPKLKPNVSRVVLVQSQENFDVMFAFVDPAYPRAFRDEPVRSHLIWVANQGCTVVVVVNKKRFIMTKDRPTFELTEEQVEQLADGRYIMQGDRGQIQVSNPVPRVYDRVDLLGSTAASRDYRYVPRRAPSRDDR